MGKSIGVISLKGGVGKTSTVISLGAALSESGKKVLLVDGNFSSPNLGLHLNVIDPQITLHHVMDRTAHIHKAVYELEKFDVIPSSVFTNQLISPLKLKDKIKSLKRNYDVILFDSSPALNDETLGVMLASDELLVVTTPDYATLSTTVKAVKLANQRGTKIDGLVLNKVYNKNFEIPLENIEKTTNVPVMAVIPYDVDFLKAQFKFVPYVFHSPNSKGSDEFRRLAATLMGERHKPVKLKKFFRWINPKRQDINREIFYKSLFE